LENKNFLLLSTRITEEGAEGTIEKGCEVGVLTAKEVRERFKNLPEEIKERVRV